MKAELSWANRTEETSCDTQGRMGGKIKTVSKVNICGLNSAQKSVHICCELVNDSVKVVNFLEQIRDCKLLKTDLTPNIVFVD